MRKLHQRQNERVQSPLITSSSGAPPVTTDLAPQDLHPSLADPHPGLRKRQVHHLFVPQTQRCNYYKQDPGKHILNPNIAVIFAFALSSILLHQGTRFPYLCTDYILQPKVIY